jgi:hypothetical protein
MVGLVGVLPVVFPELVHGKIACIPFKTLARRLTRRSLRTLTLANVVEAKKRCSFSKVEEQLPRARFRQILDSLFVGDYLC